MDEFMKFNYGDHSYHDTDGNEYTSVSKLIKSIQPEFPSNIIAKAVAKKSGRTSKEVLAEWDRKRDRAAAHGNMVHEFIRKHLTEDGPVFATPAMQLCLVKLDDELKDYSSIDCEEKIVYSTEHLVAGRPDLTCYRSRSIVDIRDFKTNLEKGIQYADKYGKYMKEPLSHLEACNYNQYCLQLSLYGYLFERSYRYGVGNLGIYFVDSLKKNTVTFIPVPYMKKEVETLLEHHVSVNNVKPVPSFKIDAFS